MAKIIYLLRFSLFTSLLFPRLYRLLYNDEQGLSDGLTLTVTAQRLRLYNYFTLFFGYSNNNVVYLQPVKPCPQSMTLPADGLTTML